MRTLRVEIMNRIKNGRAVGNDFVVVDRTDGRSTVLAHFGEDQLGAHRWRKELLAIEATHAPLAEVAP